MKLAASFLKNYSASLSLILSIVTGSIFGLIFKERAAIFKPFGDIFLNLLFSAIAVMGNVYRLGKILFSMIFVFTATGIVASFLMIAGVKMFPPTQGVQ